MLPVGDEFAAVQELVDDTINLLGWCADPESLIEGVDDRIPAIPEPLFGLYVDAIGQAREEIFPLITDTLAGENPDFSTDEVLQVLAGAGWTGPLLIFKLSALERSGRTVVREVTEAGRLPVRFLKRRIFRSFTKTLNAALRSLSGIPGVAALQELKDFVEGVQPDDQNDQ